MSEDKNTEIRLNYDEWNYNPDNDLPNLLILGDSISIGYTFYLREYLKGGYNVYSPVAEAGKSPENCLDSGTGVRNIGKWISTGRWDVIHFNWGLHDIKRVSDEPEKSTLTSLYDYKKNLEYMVKEMKKTGALLIFATTTPFEKGVTPIRFPDDAIKFNEAAKEVMKKHGVRINDLYSLVLPVLDSMQKPINVHFNEKGSDFLASGISEYILDITPEKKNPHERRDLNRKKQDITDGKIPIPGHYPYVLPDYEQRFIHIGTEKQLFLDNYILDYLYGVRRERCQPEIHPEMIISPREKPWEKFGRNKPRVLYDEKDKKYKMWYDVSLGTAGFQMSQGICYAESYDGIEWVKPVVDGCIPYGDIMETNILFAGCRHYDVIRMPKGKGKGRFAFIYSDTAEMTRPDSENSYNNTVVMYSDDGIKWETDNINTKTPRHHMPSVIYDSDLDLFVSYAQMSHHGNWITRKRQIGRSTSRDLLHWSPNDVVFSFQTNGNVNPEYEAHTFTANTVDSLYIGLLDIARTEPLWQVWDNYNWRDVFHLYTTLATSRDGISWNMLGDVEDPWLPNGKPGSIDYGYRAFNSKPVAAGDSQYIYFSTTPFKQAPAPSNGKFQVPVEKYQKTFKPWIRRTGNRHFKEGALTEEFKKGPRSFSVGQLSGGIGLVKMRRDGYMALRPVYEEGSVLTVQFLFEGNRLEINADASFGNIRVEILNHMMEPFEGFEKDDCDPVFTDNTECTVSWNGNKDVSSLWNKPIRLRFYLSEASLFSFRFYVEK